jgi:aspartate 1-decarboxylase
MEEAQMDGYQPTVVFVDEQNRMAATGPLVEPADTSAPLGMLP